MLIEIQYTILLQIFCEFRVNFKVILKSIEGSDNTCQSTFVYLIYLEISFLRDYLLGIFVGGMF